MKIRISWTYNLQQTDLGFDRGIFEIKKELEK